MTMLLRLMFAATLVHANPAFPQGSKQAIVSPSVQAEFVAFIAKFRAALKANDPVAIASMTRLPFDHDGPIRDAAQFRAKVYPSVFTAKNRACIQRGKAVYDRDGNNNENYFIFCGQLIFVFTRTSVGFRFTEISAND